MRAASEAGFEVPQITTKWLEPKKTCTACRSGRIAARHGGDTISQSIPVTPVTPNLAAQSLSMPFGLDNRESRHGCDSSPRGFKNVLLGTGLSTTLSVRQPSRAQPDPMSRSSIAVAAAERFCSHTQHSQRQ